ncbi:MAG TPA: HD domain-containing protein [archaeon]|nr:HD domain-containing protein [archaeon]
MNKLISENELKNLLEVYLTLHHTKELPRQGFISHGFKRADADSVAAHSFSVASLAFLMALQLKKQGINIDENKVVKMALFHDIGEAITGDIGRMVKILAGGAIEEVEEKAFRAMIKNLSFKSYLLDLRKEYEERESVEAVLVKACDALDAIAQAVSVPAADINEFKKENKLILKYLSEKNREIAELFDYCSSLIFEKKVLPYRGYREDIDIY